MLTILSIHIIYIFNVNFSDLCTDLCQTGGPKLFKFLRNSKYIFLDTSTNNINQPHQSIFYLYIFQESQQMTEHS